MISLCILSLQLTVRVYNINSDKNNEILKKCETLNQYSLFVERVRALQEKGRAEGEAAGRATAILELAKAMKSKGLDDTAIMELTGLSADEIVKL